MPFSPVALLPVWAPLGSLSVQELGEDQLPRLEVPEGLPQSPT